MLVNPVNKPFLKPIFVYSQLVITTIENIAFQLRILPIFFKFEPKQPLKLIKNFFYFFLKSVDKYTSIWDNITGGNNTPKT